ncbi:MAG: 4-hydroxy-tetrahydrodipicolinate reductase [Fimbriimonadaceae bacterium]
MTRVAVTGACGRMGREVVLAVSAAEDLELVGAYDRAGEYASTGQMLGVGVTDVPISTKIGAMLDESKPDVLVEFTNLAGAADHSLSALKRGVAVVIGTSGLKNEDQRAIQLAAEEYGVGAILVPNFAIGAVLMMKFAEMAATYFPNAEVLELHHDQKLDSPSGTAWHTAERIAAARESAPRRLTGTTEKAPGARGADVKGVPVHSIRLPGYVASQEVMFGAAGERLSIRHDSLDRASFMAGVLLSVREIRNRKGWLVGLDQLMG